VLKKWKRLAAVGLVLCSTCASLAVGELTLRLVGPRLWERRIGIDSYYPWIAYHPILGWVNRPRVWPPGFLINSLGFRGPEISARKPSGSLRIVCLGDSRTFGIWMDKGGFRFNNDYPAALEQLLHEQTGSERVEVINAGVIGYTSAQGLAQLQTQVLQLHPDIITVGFGFNDHSLEWNAALAAREPRSPFARESFYFASHSYWFQLGKAVYDAVTGRGVWGEVPPLSERRVDPEAYRYNLHRFAEVGSRHGIRVLFVSQALRPIEMGESAPAFPGALPDKAGLYILLGVKDLEDLHRLDRSYQDLLYKVAEQEGVPVADASTAFAERRELLFGPYDLVHSNPGGARLIAETIRQKLLELRWLLPQERFSRVSASRSPTER
jgi:lysophospholipase L1-like esterase